MIRFRTLASCVVCVLSVAPSLATNAEASEYVVAGSVNRIADRCAAQFGEGFVDNGNGICARVGNHTRLYVTPRNAGLNAWSNGATSNAAMMRTDGTIMVPGTATQHLRVRGNLDSYSPFR